MSYEKEMQFHLEIYRDNSVFQIAPWQICKLKVTFFLSLITELSLIHLF